MGTQNAALVYVLSNGKDLAFPDDLPQEKKYRRLLEKLSNSEIHFFRGATAGRFRYFPLDILKMLYKWLTLKIEGKCERVTFYFEGYDYFKSREQNYDVAYKALELEGPCKDTHEIYSEAALHEQAMVSRNFEPDNN